MIEFHLPFKISSYTYVKLFNFVLCTRYFINQLLLMVLNQWIEEIDYFNYKFIWKLAWKFFSLILKYKFFKHFLCWLLIMTRKLPYMQYKGNICGVKFILNLDMLYEFSSYVFQIRYFAGHHLLHCRTYAYCVYT